MTWAEDINVCTFVSFPAAVKRKEEGGWPGVGGVGGRWGWEVGGGEGWEGVWGGDGYRGRGKGQEAHGTIISFDTACLQLLWDQKAC